MTGEAEQVTTQGGLRRTEGSVLVVDDDEMIRAVLRDMLEEMGCAVREAADGREALSVLVEEQPDVVLLDMRMPVLDGWGFSREYRAQPGPHAPIVVMTAAQNARAWSEEVQAEGVLAKPFEFADFAAVLRRFTPCAADA